MVKLDEFLHKHRSKLIFGGLAIGFLRSMGWFLTDDFWFLGEFATWLYAGLIIVAGYTYYKFHHNKNYGPKPTSYQKVVPPRNLSAAQNYNTMPAAQQASGPSSEIFDRFRRS